MQYPEDHAVYLRCHNKQTEAIITRILEKTNQAERSIANAMSRSKAEYQVHQMEVEEELEVEMPNDPTYASATAL